MGLDPIGTWDQDELIPRCPACFHPREQHVADGCLARDDLGNRCACIEPAHW